MVSNSDWSSELGDTLDQTIQKSGILLFANDNISNGLEDEATDQEHIVEAVREIVAKELHKVAHSFRARTELLAPNNVAFWIEQRQQRITDAELCWHVTIEYAEDGLDTYAVESFSQAYGEAVVLRTYENVKSATTWFGAKTHA